MFGPQSSKPSTPFDDHWICDENYLLVGCPADFANGDGVKMTRGKGAR